MENIITLKSTEYTAKINLSRGANCISLRNERFGAEILREPDYNRLDNPFLYGMPILFPVNRIEGGSFEFEGRIYKLAVNEPDTGCHLHGTLHNSPFVAAPAGGNFVKCTRTVKKCPGFPHDFVVEINYTLSENGLLIKTVIENLSDLNMPCFLGFHTTFNVPFITGSHKENVRVFAQVGEEIERNMENYLPTGKFLSPDEITDKLNSGTLIPTEQKISRHYQSTDKGRIELRDILHKVSVVYENDEMQKFRLIYNGNADSYICLEPMTCMVNCCNMPQRKRYTGFDFIAGGKKKVYTSKIFLRED